MGTDIDAALADWPFEPGKTQARRVTVADGRDVLQLRIDLGIMQLEVDGRPDGTRPHGFPSVLDYLRDLANEDPANPTVPSLFIMEDEHCQEADQEFIQYYHRRVTWLVLEEFERAIADADHNLALMDLVKSHSPSNQYTLTHERYRPFVLFHRIQATASLALQREEPDAAIDEIRQGLKQIKTVYEEHGLAEQIGKDPMVKELRRMQRRIRKHHNIASTLREQIEKAVAEENYELAARLRDELREQENRDE